MEINKYEELSQHFFDHIIYPIFQTPFIMITDDSSLWDLMDDEEDAITVYQKIFFVYGVDVGERHRFVDIYKYISENSVGGK